MNDALPRQGGFVLGFLLLALVSNPACAQHFPSDEELELTLRYLVEDGFGVGIVVGVLEADGSTRIVQYGNPGPEARPLGPKSVFEIGSVTKTFTGVLLADMVARGEVALEDPLSRYLPGSVTVPSRNGREITLLDLATHRSGLPEEIRHIPADPRNRYADYTFKTEYDLLSSYELRRDPGAEYEYSNLGFRLLGDALARAAGMSYTDLLRQRILEPLGMTMTGFTLEGERGEWMTQGHRAGRMVRNYTTNEVVRPSGGLRSNAEDMLKYLKANVGPPTTELEHAMRFAQQIRRPGYRETMGMGLGWATDTLVGRPVITKSGGTTGFRAFVSFDPERRVGIVWLGNSRDPMDGTNFDLLVYGRAPTGNTANQDSNRLLELQGTYSYPSGFSVHIRLEEEGYLTTQSRGKARLRLYAESDSSFLIGRGALKLIFHRDGNGEVLGLRMDPSESGNLATKVATDSPPPRAVAFGVGWPPGSFRWGTEMWVLVGGLATLALFILVRWAVLSRSSTDS